KVRINCRHKVQPFKMAAGTTYQIDLVSTAFDAYLRLEDSAGKQVAQDDDSGGGLNARIVFTAKKADTYRIIVTTFPPNQTGDYPLTAQRPSAAAAALAALKQEMQEATLALALEVRKAKSDAERQAVNDR